MTTERGPNNPEGREEPDLVDFTIGIGAVLGLTIAGIELLERTDLVAMARLTGSQIFFERVIVASVASLTAAGVMEVSSRLRHKR